MSTTTKKGSRMLRLVGRVGLLYVAFCLAFYGTRVIVAAELGPVALGVVSLVLAVLVGGKVGEWFDDRAWAELRQLERAAVLAREG